MMEGPPAIRRVLVGSKTRTWKVDRSSNYTRSRLAEMNSDENATNVQTGWLDMA